jgi:hypothetical protein
LPGLIVIIWRSCLHAIAPPPWGGSVVSQNLRIQLDRRSAVVTTA